MNQFSEPPDLESLSREQLIRAIRHLVTLLNKLTDAVTALRRALEEKP